MGRKKKDNKKGVEIRFRVEVDLKIKFCEYCKDNGFIPSKRMRELIINDLTKDI